MNQQKQHGFGVIEIIIIIAAVAIIGIIGWKFYAISNEKTARDGQSSEYDPRSPTTTELPGSSIYSERISSAKGAFSVQIPKGWGTVLRPTTDDLLSIKGQSQPRYDASRSVVVEDIGGWGGDSPSLFTIFLSDNVAEPRGDFVEFKAGALTGKKYTYIALEDSERGLGQEDKGDKFYEYRFNLKDKNQLVVWYSVYAKTDPNDQIEIVDTIVQSLQLQQ